MPAGGRARHQPVAPAASMVPGVRRRLQPAGAGAVLGDDAVLETRGVADGRHGGGAGLRRSLRVHAHDPAHRQRVGGRRLTACRSVEEDTVDDNDYDVIMCGWYCSSCSLISILFFFFLMI